ncbi:MAG: transcriptional regulator [Alphaproteobacteria bacterium]|nr:MAG: transcriptional regulator [Alphaproteobacteria bacterium]
MIEKQSISTRGRVTSIDVIVGGNLRKIRLLNNISQKKTGEIIGVRFQQIQKYEKGVNQISAGNLFKLSDFYDVDIRVFYDGLMNGQCQGSMPEFSPKVLEIAKLLDQIDNPEYVDQLNKMVAEYEVGLKEKTF